MLSICADGVLVADLEARELRQCRQKKLQRKLVDKTR